MQYNKESCAMCKEQATQRLGGYYLCDGHHDYLAGLRASDDYDS
jgi:hypothetical protein